MSGPNCDCGHTSAEHAPLAKVRITRRPCLVDGCDCQHFHVTKDEGPDAA